MNYQSYLNCRNYSFIVKLWDNQYFHQYINNTKIGIGWYEFSRAVTKVVQEKNHKSQLKKLYDEFYFRSHNELFDTEDDAKKFYSIDEYKNC